MKFNDGVEDQAAVVCVEGRVDASNADELEEHCKGHLAEHDRASLVLDLSKVDYMSSAGLRAVLRLGKHTHVRGGKLVLSGLTGAVREIVDIAGFLGLFPVADNVEQALGLTSDTLPPSRPR